MPIRTATLNHQLHRNGVRLHLAMMSRVRSQGADQPPSEDEQALLDERRRLKEARALRQAQIGKPKVKAARPVKVAKPPKAPKPKVAKEPKAEKAKDAKAHTPSRAIEVDDRLADVGRGLAGRQRDEGAGQRQAGGRIVERSRDQRDRRKRRIEGDLRDPLRFDPDDAVDRSGARDQLGRQPRRLARRTAGAGPHV